ncbi:MAG TPA: hypothetical protein VFI31_13485 [Pirellulales bacterium]|nr:hypothetical protein [Pirellulales bacterium]
MIAALEDHANWAADYPESSDERLIDPDLTEPLPPLVSVNFNQQEINHPRVKVVVVETPPSADDNALADAAAADPKSKTASPAKKPAAPIFGLRDKKPAADKSPPEKTAPEKPAEEEKKEQKPSGPPPTEIVRYRLFRFFDFDVQPGKTYCYRVKLVALNPNYELPARYLANGPASKDTRERVSPSKLNSLPSQRTTR